MFYRTTYFPMNLQFFAAETGDGSQEVIENQENHDVETPDAPTYEQLVAQLASERAEKERYKTANDKLSREAAESKKQLREKMTAEERAAEEKRTQEAAKDARIKELESKMQVIEYTSFYMGKDVGMDEKLARETAEAEVSGDREKFNANLIKHIKAIRTEAYQQLLAERPDIRAGHGDDNGESLAVQKARELSKGRSGGVNQDILKNFM